MRRLNLSVLALFSFSAGLLCAELYNALRPMQFPQPPGPELQEKMLRDFSAFFHLNTAQEEGVRQIFKESQEQLMVLHQEVFPRVDRIRQSVQDKIRAQLNPEQQERYDAIHRRHAERIKEMFKDTGGIPPPPPLPAPPPLE